MSDSIIQLINVVKAYGNHIAVRDVSLDIKQGEFLTLLGPSGCGKTTTLRLIAGFEQPTSGTILMEGVSMEGKQPYERNVNTVFQNYALFPHMNVFNNVAFGLTMKKVSKAEIEKRVMEALELVQLVGYEKRMPNQLSGGQKQRVAIARALVNNPKVLLLDEPLGALDLKLRKQMQAELKRLQKKLGITFVYVTHDQEEALTMSDRIALMDKGAIEQIGSPAEIYERPKTKFVAGFIGETNLFEAQVSRIEGEYTILQVENGEIPVVNQELTIGEPVYLSIRPERIRFSYSPEGKKFALRGWFKERIYVGSVLKTIISLDNSMEVVINESVDQSSSSLIEPGRELFLTWEPSQAVVVKAWPEEVGHALGSLNVNALKESMAMSK